MTVHATSFEASVHSDIFRTTNASSAMGVLSAQTGAAEALEPGQHGSIANSGRYVLLKVTADCRIDVVAGTASASAASGVWLAGEADVRYVAPGQRISVAPL